MNSDNIVIIEWFSQRSPYAKRINKLAQEVGAFSQIEDGGFRLTVSFGDLEDLNRRETFIQIWHTVRSWKMTSLLLNGVRLQSLKHLHLFDCILERLSFGKSIHGDRYCAGLALGEEDGGIDYTLRCRLIKDYYILNRKEALNLLESSIKRNALELCPFFDANRSRRNLRQWRARKRPNRSADLTVQFGFENDEEEPDEESDKDNETPLDR